MGKHDLSKFGKFDVTLTCERFNPKHNVVVGRDRKRASVPFARCRSQSGQKRILISFLVHPRPMTSMQANGSPTTPPEKVPD